MPSPFRILLVSIVLVSLATARAQNVADGKNAGPNSLTQAEIDRGGLLLFDGETTYGWNAVGKAEWKVVDGELRAAGDAEGFLVTTSDFGDYELRAQFKTTPETNSGVFVHSAPEPKDPTTDCYEVNIAATGANPWPTGGIAMRAKRTVEIPDSTEWQEFTITTAGDTVTIDVGEKEVLKFTDPKALRRGRIALQARFGKIAFRGIKLFPKFADTLKLDANFSEWKIFPGKAAEYVVNANGELHVENGPGMLEYVARPYGDFALTWAVKTNAEKLNSGVFFRQIPGEFTNGYECQIQNAFKDGDRTQPVDCGTGGFYRRSNARRIVGNDLEWTRMTLIATGPHMAAWVNGIQVSDWTDERKPDANPRKGLRTEAGTLSIQGHDPTTDILFKDFRAGPIAARDEMSDVAKPK